MAGSTGTANLAPGTRGPQGADDRRRGEDPRPGVRRRLDLEDPLPRGPEAALAAAHRRAATASTARPTSSACGPSCGMQRDEFLPLRVIRQELADRRLRRDEAERRAPGAARASASSRWRPTSLEELSTTPASATSAARAAGLRHRPAQRPRRPRASTTRPTSRSSVPPPSWPRFGVEGRNLKVFRTSADRESALLEQLLGPSCARATRHAAGRRSRTSRPWPQLRQPQAPDAGSRPAPPNRRVGHRVPEARPPPGSLAASAPDVWRAGRPIPSTCRAGGRDLAGRERPRRAGAGRAHWTQVLETARRPRACAPTTAAPPSARRRYAFEQELAGTPFERVLRSSRDRGRS